MRSSDPMRNRPRKYHEIGRLKCSGSGTPKSLRYGPLDVGKSATRLDEGETLQKIGK
jgi:hypothetical protein